jgi:hypothetical protein
MRPYIIFALLLALVGCSSDPSRVGSSLPAAIVPGFAELRLGAPIEHESLTIIPVSTTKQDQNFDDYVTLAQAKKEGWIEIVEVPGQETVNTLKVRYTGPRPMILFAGELLLGGKQDRVVGKDTIIKPDETVDVMVFCVEPGRWDGESMHFEPQASQVPLDVKEMAIRGDQGDVWNKVGAYNDEARSVAGADFSGSSLKGGYGAVTNSKEYNAALDKAMKELKSRKDVVGVVIIVNGKINSFEYFQSPRLFSATSESVLRGALATAFIQNGKGGVPPMKEVADFVSRSLKSANEAPVDTLSGFTSFGRNSMGVSGGVSREAAKDDGLVIHGTFYEKKD